MIASAADVYPVADATNIGKPLFASLGRIEQIGYLITDTGIQ
jgi:DeoR/GlpR family transcriptional regulator of sugar metabolism